MNSLAQVNGYGTVFRDATPEDVRHVCANLTAHHAREVFALRYQEDPDDLAAAILARAPYEIMLVAILAPDGRAAALAGAWLAGPGRAAVEIHMTEQWLTIARDGYLALRRHVPAVLSATVRIAETSVLEDGPDREWLRRLGFIERLPAVPRGKNGEAYVDLVWINPITSGG